MSVNFERITNNSDDDIVKIQNFELLIKIINNLFFNDVADKIVL